MFFSCSCLNIEKQSKKIKKLIILVQDSLRMQIDQRNEKRAFYTLPAMKGKASLTVEAAMVVPLFIFAMIYVIYGMNVMQLQSKIQCALDTTALEMAGYAPSAQIEGDNIVGEFISEIVYTNLGGKVLFLNNLKKIAFFSHLTAKSQSGARRCAKGSLPSPLR